MATTATQEGAPATPKERAMLLALPSGRIATGILRFGISAMTFATGAIAAGDDDQIGRIVQ